MNEQTLVVSLFVTCSFVNVDKLTRSDRLKKSLKILSFLECQQDPLKKFHESGMDWYRFWNTLNLKPDICIAQVKKNPLRILNLMTILVLPWDFS